VREKKSKPLIRNRQGKFAWMNIWCAAGFGENRMRLAVPLAKDKPVLRFGEDRRRKGARKSSSESMSHPKELRREQNEAGSARGPL